jgi:hypothetical protein
MNNAEFWWMPGGTPFSLRCIASILNCRDAIGRNHIAHYRWPCGSCGHDDVSGKNACQIAAHHHVGAKQLSGGE